MFVVIKLGGCNGSGKTSVARAFIDLTKAKLQAAAHKADKHYLGELNGIKALTLGSYENVCGGMDTISDKDLRYALVERHARQGNIVLFEGLITGKTYGALGLLSEQHVKERTASKRGSWLYAFLDTPFDVCVARTEQRRRAAGNANPLDPERTLRPTFNSCQHLYEKLNGTRAAKNGPQPYPHETILLDHRRKPARLAEELWKRAEGIYNARR